MVWKQALCIFLLLHARGDGALENNLIATGVFETGGVTGWIRFYQKAADNITFVANLEGLSANASWSLHLLPVDLTLDPQIRCGDNFLGGIYNPGGVDESMTTCTPQNPEMCAAGDFSGRYGDIPAPSGLLRRTDTTGQYQVLGRNSIVGRSLVVEPKGQGRICATIRSQDERNGSPNDLTIYSATFFSPVAGTIFFRQFSNNSVTIYGKLFYVTNSPTTMNHTWHVHELGPDEGAYQLGQNCTGDTIGGHFDPFNANASDVNYLTRCTPSTPGGCELGDLTGKHAPINIDGGPSDYATSAFLFTDTTLQLSGINDIFGRSLAIHELNGGPMIIACAPIVRVETITASEFSQFYLTIEQSSPHENSSLVLSNQFPSNNPSLEVLPDALMTNSLCPVGATVTAYNPYNVTATNDNDNIRTPDSFPLGNLSGKYELQGPKPSQLSLNELPLYGPNTLLSRTIRLTKQVGGRKVTMCSGLVPPKGESGALLKATFNDGAVQGGVYMVQDIPFESVRGSTNVVVDLYYSSASAETTKDHKWIISDMTCDSIMSQQATIFNPLMVDTTNPPYNDECNRLQPLRCQNGDMSGKHGTLKLSPLSPNRVTYTFVDPNLQLAGAFSVKGKSLVIKSASGGEEVLACTSLQKLDVSEPQNTVVFSTPARDDFDRVNFVNSVTSVPPLNGVLPPSNILVLHEELGPRSIEGTDVTCATLQMLVIAVDVPIANMYAQITQRSLCERYREDVCLRSLPSSIQPCPQETAGTKGLQYYGFVSVLGALLCAVLTL